MRCGGRIPKMRQIQVEPAKPPRGTSHLSADVRVVSMFMYLVFSQTVDWQPGRRSLCQVVPANGILPRDVVST